MDAGSETPSWRDGPRHWERVADRWLRWARKPDHDAYWRYRDAFLTDVVPPTPGSATLEVGCGEGRVSRDLARRGHRVVAIDAAPTLLRHARAAEAGAGYLVAAAEALPFGDESFDLVVAYNSLMDVDDLAGAVVESGRVLLPGGHLCACVTHPLADAGAFTGEEPNAPFVIEGSYLELRRFEGTCERAGLSMDFRGWAYPLEEYARALEHAGLLIEIMREPVPAGGDSSYRQWERVPMFLFFRALKP